MEKIKDLISIIVPIYNAERVLPRCLESLLSQTYRPIEIILINDGSKDGSLAVCEKYAEKESFIKVISKENGGTATARNAGLDIAQGEYIVFVDADDYVKNDFCEELYNALKRADARCVVSRLIITDTDGNPIGETRIPAQQTITGKDSLHEMYCKGNHGISLVEVCGKIFHHSMWDTLRFCAGMYYEDLEIMPRLYYELDRISEISYMGYFYVTYEESASHGKGTDDKRVWDSIAIREKHIDYFEEKNDKELARSIAGRLFDLIMTSAQNGWIPNDQIPSVAATFKKYWKQYKNSGGFSTKTRLKYDAFCLGGKRSFKSYHG